MNGAWSHLETVQQISADALCSSNQNHAHATQSMVGLQFWRLANKGAGADAPQQINRRVDKQIGTHEVEYSENTKNCV
ncbi:MAG: hypothetical protein ABJP79_10860 [Tateyamaria sp.]|uniref:hypothetical protein n=1 Tax=Tateyamaria sp. TaxID=1929288 RepID=UPI00329CDC65